MFHESFLKSSSYDLLIYNCPCCGSMGSRHSAPRFLESFEEIGMVEEGKKQVAPWQRLDMCVRVGGFF